MYKTKSGPGWVAQLVGVLACTSKVMSLNPTQGAYRKHLIDVSLLLLLKPMKSYLSVRIKYKIPRVNPNVNSGLRYLSEFTDSNKCTTVVWAVDSGEGCAFVVQGVYRKIPVTSHYYCESKTTL